MFLVLFASFTDVIGLGLALAAEILLTFLTSDSELAHVNSCFARYWLSNIILGVVIYLTWDHFHDIFTAACDQIRVL